MNRNRVDILAELSRSSVLKLNNIGIRRRYQDNQVVQQRGDLPDHALVLISGRLRAVLHTASGTEQLSRWQEAGEISGIGSVLADTPVPVDLIATGAVEVLILPKQPFMDFLASDAAACIILIRTLTLRVNELFDISFVRAADTLRDRVWATLQRLANENGQRLSADRTALRISQSDLARAVGASRQRVNEELRKLEAEKKVVRGYRRLVLVDTQ